MVDFLSFINHLLWLNFFIYSVFSLNTFFWRAPTKNETKDFVFCPLYLRPLQYYVFSSIIFCINSLFSDHLFRYIEEHVQKTGVAIETQGFTIVTSGKKRESLLVRQRVEDLKGKGYPCQSIATRIITFKNI